MQAGDGFVVKRLVEQGGSGAGGDERSNRASRHRTWSNRKEPDMESARSCESETPGKRCVEQER